MKRLPEQKKVTLHLERAGGRAGCRANGRAGRGIPCGFREAGTARDQHATPPGGPDRGHAPPAGRTKPVTAAAAILLVEEAKLRLDDPVDRWLPELATRMVFDRC